MTPRRRKTLNDYDRGVDFVIPRVIEVGYVGLLPMMMIDRFCALMMMNP